MNKVAQRQLPSTTVVGKESAFHDVFSASYATILFGMMSVSSEALLSNDFRLIQEPPLTTYSTIFTQSTYSPFEETLISPDDSDVQKFVQEITSIYATLAEGQEPLGKEFESILNANIRRLYKS